VPELINNSVLITGCSSGIGHTVARGLNENGYRVFATARSSSDVQRLQSEGLEALHLDLMDEQSMESALNQILDRTGGRLYALFNNGAYGQPGAVEDLTTDVLRQQFETNLFGWHELTRRVLPVMRAQGVGRIIQNSSVLGFVSLAYRGAYNASKYALEGLSDTLRLELHGSNIYVSLIEPGPITSRFRENAYRKWQENIDAEHSAHREKYRIMEGRLTKEGPAAPFTLPPEAVLKRVIHALESPRPKARYYVTFPTYLFAFLKRVLPVGVLDSLLRKVSN
jgi:NAD(P)-dependent dehydrogenase (short-subunit alcohol dehydrogenase family)